MSERRKPEVVMHLRINKCSPNGKNKSAKIEVFSAEQWGHKKGPRGGKRFRLRVNGKWFKDAQKNQFSFFDKWQIRDLIWRSVNL